LALDPVTFHPFPHLRYDFFMTQMTLEQAFNLAVQQHRAGKLREAESIYRQILSAQPNQPETLHMLGLLAYQSGHASAAVDLIGKAIAINPNDAAYHSNLGMALTALGRLDEAAKALQNAIRLEPNLPEPHNNLGNTFRALGRLDEAAAMFRKAIQLSPSFTAARINLGNIHRARGEFEQAISEFLAALRINPHLPEAQTNLANTLLDQGKLADAMAAYRAAVGLDPSNSLYHYNLGVALERNGQTDEAMACLRGAIRLNPRFIPAYHLGALLQDCGQIDEAIACFRGALSVDPNAAIVHSGLCYALHFHPDSTPESILREHRDWNQRFAAPLTPKTPTFANDRSPDRKLKIGYVSPNFHEHPVARFLLPLLENHDRQNVRIFCYGGVARPDDYTHRAQRAAEVWRDVRGLGDAQLADQIREDGIDILVDLSAHLADNRLLAFARRPAPVQMTYLAYCSTTGVDAIGYRISDGVLDPPGADESVYAEKTVRLPHCYWCYEPPANAPEVGPLPAQRNGHVTFGCLNNFSKVSAAALDAWVRILGQVPGSHLILHARPGSHRQRVLERFAAGGIAAERIRFVEQRPQAQYLATYNDIDIALDSFPYAGGTTSCDALWMGAALVTLRGEIAVGRGGATILHTLGLDSLTANDVEAYVTSAVGLARDLPRLTELRSTLRLRMQSSPLMNAAQFARDMETLYREIWRRWCAAP
jgi:predicted O-linked N-acetylglucosamine transferase (SPINDLY family)